MAVRIACVRSEEQIRVLAESILRNSTSPWLARQEVMGITSKMFRPVIDEEYQREVTRRATAGAPTFENRYSDGQLKCLLDDIFAPPLTFAGIRSALETFVPARLRPAVIEAYRDATAVPAALFVLKFEKKIDHLLPDDPKPQEPNTCENCADAVEEPQHRWCSDCASRVFYDLPNERP